MHNLITSYLSDETGAAAAEYALILAIVGAGIAAAVFALGSQISTTISKATACISSTTGSC